MFYLYTRPSPHDDPEERSPDRTRLVCLPETRTVFHSQLPLTAHRRGSQTASSLGARLSRRPAESAAPEKPPPHHRERAMRQPCQLHQWYSSVGCPCPICSICYRSKVTGSG